MNVLGHDSIVIFLHISKHIVWKRNCIALHSLCPRFSLSCKIPRAIPFQWEACTAQLERQSIRPQSDDHSRKTHQFSPTEVAASATSSECMERLGHKADSARRRAQATPALWTRLPPGRRIRSSSRVVSFLSCSPSLTAFLSLRWPVSLWKTWWFGWKNSSSIPYESPLSSREFDGLLTGSAFAG